jgi:hypothetical protein
MKLEMDLIDVAMNVVGENQVSCTVAVGRVKKKISPLPLVRVLYIAICGDQSISKYYAAQL